MSGKRDGSELGAWIRELLGPELEARAAAGMRITAMSWGIAGDPEASWDVTPGTVEAFGPAVRGVFDDPAFPAGETLRGLIREYRGNPRAKRDLSLRRVQRALRGKRDPNETVMQAIEALLPEVGPAAVAILPELIEIIREKPGGRPARFAAAVLEGIGPGAEPAVEALLAGLARVGDEWDGSIEEKVIWNSFIRALAMLGSADAGVLGRIERAAAGGEAKLRAGAIVTLGEIGEAARPALGTLLAATESPEVARQALEALERVARREDVEVVTALRGRLATCAEDDRPALVAMLRKLGVGDAEIADGLEAGFASAREAVGMPERRLPAGVVAVSIGEDDSDDDCESCLPEVDTTTAPEKSAAELIRDLASGDAKKRVIAGNTLMELWAGGTDVVDSSSPTPEERFFATVSGVFADPAFPTAEVLATLIDRYTHLMRDYARHVSKSKNWKLNEPLHEALSSAGMMMPIVIENCGPAGVAALSRLEGMLRNDTSEGALSSTAAKAMKGIGPAARGLVDALLDNVLAKDVREWPNARIEALAAFGLSEGQLGRVIAALQRRAAGAYAACAVLEALGPAAAAAGPALLLVNRTGDARLLADAVRALGAVSGADAGLVEELLERTRDPEGEARSETATALGRMVEAPDAVIERLFELTRDAEWYVRGRAIEALGRLGLRPEAVAARAIELLDDEEGYDWTVAESAVEAIAGVGAAAAGAVPKLVSLLDDDGPDQQVLEALGAIGPAAGVVLDRLRIMRTYPGNDRASIEAAMRKIQGG